MNEFWEQDTRPAVEAARQAWIDAAWEADKLPVWDAAPEPADDAFAKYFELFRDEPEPEAGPVPYTLTPRAETVLASWDRFHGLERADRLALGEAEAELEAEL